MLLTGSSAIFGVPYRQSLPVQHGTGAPSSGVGTTGAASAEIAHTIPTIRNNILTARFMGVSPSTGPLGAATLTWQGLYRVVSSTIENSLALPV